MLTDVLVLGSGAAALTAAVTAAHAGRKVMVLERDTLLGGTSAISGGALWIPGTRQAMSGRFQDSRDHARLYLQNVLGESYRAELIETFLARGPEALAFLEDHTEIRYSVRALSPDYYPELPGATDCGRALEVGEFDGRRLGTAFELLRPPPKGMMGLGGMMVNRADIQHFLKMRRSPRSFLHLTKLALRFWRDRLRYSRGTRLVIGNALVAGLLKAALDAGVTVELGIETQSFVTDAAGQVVGVIARRRDGPALDVHAERGVILGTGGLSHKPGALADRPGTRDDHLSMAAPKADGTLIGMAQAQLGAGVGGHLRSNFYWAPMSRITHADGSREIFPHIVTDRAKPGIIAVTDRGVRFVNEANSYHRFVEAMIAEQQHGVSHFYLLADRRALNAYGLGLVRPRPGVHRTFLQNGYLVQAGSVRELATALGIEPAALAATVEEFNRDATAGVDRRFHKGETAYNRAMGDASAPHPCLRPLDTPPFSAVRVFTGDLGSAKGLMTDGHARVLRLDGGVIDGLYAVGTDMNSVMGGTYPGPGIVLGTGLTFGYIAGRHCADRT